MSVRGMIIAVALYFIAWMNTSRRLFVVEKDTDVTTVSDGRRSSSPSDGAFVVVGGVGVGRNLNVGDGLGVKGDAVFGDDMVVEKDANFKGNTTTYDNGEVFEDQKVGGDLHVDGEPVFKFEVTTKAGLKVMGSVEVGRKLKVSKETVIGADLTVHGNFNVDGATSMKNDDSILKVKYADRADGKSIINTGATLDFESCGGTVYVETPDPYLGTTEPPVSGSGSVGGGSTVDMSEVYTLLNNLETTLRQYTDAAKANAITEVKNYTDTSITSISNEINTSLDSKADLNYVNTEVSNLQTSKANQIYVEGEITQLNDILNGLLSQANTITQELQTIKQGLTFEPDRNIVSDPEGKLAAGLPAGTAAFVPTSDPGEAPDGYVPIWIEDE